VQLGIAGIGEPQINRDTGGGDPDRGSSAEKPEGKVPQ
jgi:hypothetical protein